MRPPGPVCTLRPFAFVSEVELRRREGLERHVDLAVLKRELHRRRFRVVADDQVRRLRLRCPSSVVPLQHCLLAGRELDELVRPGSDLRLGVRAQLVVPEYVSLGTMKQHCVASTDGHVTCGDLRWNVTAYWPFVVTLCQVAEQRRG